MQRPVNNFLGCWDLLLAFVGVELGVFLMPSEPAKFFF